MGRLTKAQRKMIRQYESAADRAAAGLKLHSVGDSFDWHIAGAVFTCRVDAVCQFCGAVALVSLPLPLLQAQPDDTTHVCHPALGGCNHGFSCKPAVPS